MFAVLHLADLSLHALLRTAPELADCPVGLLRETGGHATVIALNAAARAHGVTLGLTAPQALARCAQLRLRPVEAGADAEANAALLAAGRLLSPTVEATTSGVVTADLRALPRAQHEPFLRTALDQLAELALPATGGLAATPLLALYAARQPTASHRLNVVRDHRRFLAQLPITAADPPPEMVAILRSWGLHTLGQLTALPKADVAQRLGPSGLALWERAAGETTRPLVPAVAPATFAAHLDLEEAIETLEPLLFLLRRFVDRLALELRAAGLAASEMEITLPLEDESMHSRHFRLPEPTANADLLFRTLDAHLATVRTATAVTGLRLRVEPTRSLARQHGLFDTGLRDPHGFADTLARTASLVGTDRVGTPSTRDSHRPDSVRLIPPPPTVAPPPTPPLPALGLPLRRFRPPHPLTVELVDRAPAYLWTENRRGVVSEHRGPWHASGEWWANEEAWQREEWDVALADGGLYRVLRTPHGWWLEGEYD